MLTSGVDILRIMELLAWGANSYGQLGLGFKSEQVLIPTKVPNFDANNIKQICAGAGHTLILTKSRSVFTCGWNSKGQLGSNIPDESLDFIEILQNFNIDQISCGWDFNAAISCGHDLYVWGSNAFLQLGASKRIKESFEPILIKNIKARDVSCGLRHLAVLQTNGTIAICGNGNKGQLGLLEHGKKLKQSEFITIPDLSDIIAVSCGQCHTLALQMNGTLYGWGSNKHGQLGLDPEIHPEILTPFKINLNLIPAEIYTGWTHSIIKTKNGELFNFGRNSYSQLGSEREHNWPATKLNCERVQKFVAGSEHNLAIINGKLFCWGWNEHGNCGTGTVEDVTKPTEISINGKCVYIACGTGQSFAIVDNETDTNV